MVDLKRCINILALSVVYLSLARHVDGADFCGTAMDKPLCENMVNGAANWDEAITKAVTQAMAEVAKASQSGNPKCKEAYTDTEDKLKESMETIKSGNKDGSLNFQLSAALTSLEDCTNALKDLEEDGAAAEKLNNGVEQAIRVCLAVDTSKSAA